jgi:hypothetical protein
MAESVVGALREPFSEEHTKSVNTICEPFGPSGEWPIWQDVDVSLGALGLDAAAVLSSLPRVRSSEATVRDWSYTLTWYMNPNQVPRHDQLIALTVAGLRQVEGAEPLPGAFARCSKRRARDTADTASADRLGTKPNVSPGQPFLPTAPKCVGPLHLTSRACASIKAQSNSSFAAGHATSRRCLCVGRGQVVSDDCGQLQRHVR